MVRQRGRGFSDRNATRIPAFDVFHQFHAIARRAEKEMRESGRMIDITLVDEDVSLGLRVVRITRVPQFRYGKPCQWIPSPFPARL